MIYTFLQLIDSEATAAVTDVSSPQAKRTGTSPCLRQSHNPSQRWSSGAVCDGQLDRRW